ncbi:hypothetical protein ElyMa_005264200 [Elysia marginata]|uniref:Uncharacterized protein n=1 Tax=Elysia marginata TaxID=1093978 RepID=A0AAV4K2H2_9GAST|nr:hypothetical protein ElyMa_005264200 [Elysia marginata]
MLDVVRDKERATLKAVLTVWRDRLDNILALRSCAPTTRTYDVTAPTGSVGFTADDWLTSILDFLRYGLRPSERPRSA